MSSEGESKYGFKDKSAAEDSLKLLAKEELQYQKLTVRGLIGRAKRVLTLTKSEEKLKNINEAIAVYDKWLKDHDTGSTTKNSKPAANEDKPDTVPGLGFKDKEAAEKTLKILEGRDPEYQKLAINGLIGSSKRVLSGTKNPDKVKAIKEGVKVLEDFLEEFDRENHMKDNLKYLSYELIEQLPGPVDNDLQIEFLDVYSNKAKCNYKHLRTLYPSGDDTYSWDIVRNRELKKIRDKIYEKKMNVFTPEGEPIAEHFEMIYWAYSPAPEKVKYFLEKLYKKAEKRPSPTKSKSADKEKDVMDVDRNKDSDDDLGGSSSDDSSEDDDAPSKKKRKV